MEMSQESKNKPAEMKCYGSKRQSLIQVIKKITVPFLVILCAFTWWDYYKSGTLDFDYLKRITIISVVFVFYHTQIHRSLWMKIETGHIVIKAKHVSWRYKLDQLQFSEYIPPSGSKAIQVTNPDNKKYVLWESSFIDYDRFRADLIAMNLLENKESN